MARALDELHLTQTTESTRGRVRRPSEKVQAMFGELLYKFRTRILLTSPTEERQQEKEALEQEAHAKAKRRKELTLKRKQASQAAEQDPTKASTKKVRGDPPGAPQTSVALPPDSAFTSRSVPGTNTTNNTRANLSSQLISRKGIVPPVLPPVHPINPSPKVTPNSKATGMLPARIRVLTPAQAVKLQQLKGSVPSENPESSPIQKRAKDRHAASLPKKLPAKDTKPTMATAKTADGGIDLTNDDSDNADSDNLVSRKRARCATVLSGDDERYEGITNVKSEELLDDPDALSPGAATTNAASTETTKTGTKGRPKAGDYNTATRTLLQTAIQIYCSILLTDNSFPPAVKEEEWAGAAWKLACRHHKVEADHNPSLVKLITARTSNIRGQFKTKARTIVMTTYGFESSQDEATLKRNRALVAELKTASAFIYRTRGSCLDEHTGIYVNPAIQQVINEVLFKHGNDDGLRWAKYYSPFPCVGFALALTAIECAIDEWTTGVRQTIAFREEDYTAVFLSHETALINFGKATAQYKLLPTILKQVFENGRAHAGVTIASASNKKQAVPDRAFMNAIREYQQANSIDVTAQSDDADAEVQGVLDQQDDQGIEDVQYGALVVDEDMEPRDGLDMDMEAAEDASEVSDDDY